MVSIEELNDLDFIKVKLAGDGATYLVGVAETYLWFGEKKVQICLKWPVLNVKRSVYAIPLSKYDAVSKDLTEEETQNCKDILSVIKKDREKFSGRERVQ